MTAKSLWLVPLCGMLGAWIPACSSSPSGDGGTTTGTGTTSGTGGSTTGTTGATTGGTTVGLDCDPNAATDGTCVPRGLQCDGVNLPDGGQAGTCQLPGDQASCTTSVGCRTGYSCVAGVFGSGTTCVQQCTHTSDCSSPFKSCAAGLISSTQAGCYFNACGPGSNSDGGVANGSDFYASCDAQASADGTCVPYTVSGTSAAGFCVQAGNVLANQPCGNTRDGTDAGLCGIGEICVALNINENGVFKDATACLPLCTVNPPESADGGPVCASNALCEAIYSGEPFGACFQTCLIASPTCPPPLGCLSINGDPTNGVCGPV
jgi:hypothetical protein